MFCVSIHQVLKCTTINFNIREAHLFRYVSYPSYKYLIEFRQSPRNDVLCMHNQKIFTNICHLKVVENTSSKII